jgi:hypothetical protein
MSASLNLHGVLPAIASTRPSGKSAPCSAGIEDDAERDGQGAFAERRHGPIDDGPAHDLAGRLQAATTVAGYVFSMPITPTKRRNFRRNMRQNPRFHWPFVGGY